MRAKTVRPSRAGLCSNLGHTGHTDGAVGPGQDLLAVLEAAPA
jgi:hypothetical protein